MTTADLAHAITEAVQGIWACNSGTAAINKAQSSGSNDASDWPRATNLLAQWAEKRELLDEDGIEWPAPAVVQLAQTVASSLKGQGFSPPTRLVPSGEGGIVFEYQRDRELQTIEIDDHGTIELCRFNDAKLADRRQIPAPSVG